MLSIVSRKPILSGFLLILFIVFTAIAILSKNTTVSTDTVQVVASFYPLAEFAKQVGGERVTVTNITPAGSEPHDFDPAPKDIAKIHSSDIFIWSGQSLEPWAPKVLATTDANTFQVVNASQGIDLIKWEDTADPHFWLDPSLAKTIVKNIKDELSKIDPENSQYYEQNADAYSSKLDDLDKLFMESLSSCKINKVITSHEVFGYLAGHYGFAATAISGLSPDEEPSPSEMAELTGLIKRDRIKFILTETLVSPKLADTLAKETGATTLTFNPVEGLTQDEILSGKDYISVQKENVAHLATALECKTK